MRFEFSLPSTHTVLLFRKHLLGALPVAEDTTVNEARSCSRRTRAPRDGEGEANSYHPEQEGQEVKDDDKMGGLLGRAGEGQGLAMQRLGMWGWLGISEHTG